MQIKSLERSLQIGLVISLLVLMLLFWWAGSLVTRLLSESLVYSRLETEASHVLGAMEFPDIEVDAPRMSNARLHPAYDSPYSGKYYFVSLNGESNIYSRSTWEQDFNFVQLPPGGQEKGRITGKTAEPILYWSGGFAVNGHQFTVTVAEDMSPIHERLTVFQIYFAAITLLLLIALLIVQHLIVRLSLKKLQTVRGDIHKLEQGQAVALSENVPTEILPLVHEFNRLLLLFDQRLKHSRNALGNLAHTLKGPLNLLLRYSDNAEGDMPDNSRVQLKQNTEQILQIIEGELKRARLAGQGGPGQLFDLKAEIPSLCGLLKQTYSDKDIDIHVDVEHGVVLHFDRQDMLELIGNLLDNAVKWAATSVHLSVASVSDSSLSTLRQRNPGTTTEANQHPGRRQGIRFTIEDDGPGCSPDQFHRLTERGVRLDESVAGHGLGLSIVKDIVETYSGVLELQKSSRLGGLFVGVYLPVAAAIGQADDVIAKELAGKVLNENANNPANRDASVISGRHRNGRSGAGRRATLSNTSTTDQD